MNSLLHIAAVKALNYRQLEAAYSHFAIDNIEAKIEDQMGIISKFTENNANAQKNLKNAKSEGQRLKAANNALEAQNIESHRKLAKTNGEIEALSKAIRLELDELNIDTGIEQDARVLEKATALMEGKYTSKIRWSKKWIARGHTRNRPKGVGQGEPPRPHKLPH